MKNVFLLKIYLFLSFVYESFACICVCTAHVCLVPWGRKRCLHSLELDFKLWAVILWVPRTELRFFVRAARFLNCWPICCFGARGSTPEPCTSKTVPRHWAAENTFHCQGCGATGSIVSRIGIVPNDIFFSVGNRALGLEIAWQASYLALNHTCNLSKIHY